MFDHLKKNQIPSARSSSGKNGKNGGIRFLISLGAWALGTLSGLVKLAIATCVVTGIVAYISYYTVSGYVKGQTVAVPLIVGEDVSKALSLLANQGLTLELERREFSDKKPEGMILDQNPLPETRVKTGAPVLVKVSAGQKMTTVPDLRRRNVPQAEIMIQDAGLRSGIRSEIESAVVSPGMIVTTDPPPNASAARESRVNLLISAGPSKVEIGMPRLTGRSIEEASQLLALLGLAIDETYEEPRNDIAPGVVVSQSPLPGIIVSEEDSIRLVIALKSSRETAGGPGSNPVNVLKVLDYN